MPGIGGTSGFGGASGGGSGTGDIYTVQVEEADGVAGISAAITQVIAAGGGRVLCGPGDFLFTERLVVSSDANGVWIQGSGPATRFIHADDFDGNVIEFTAVEVRDAVGISNAAVGATSITFSTASHAGTVQAGDRIIITGSATDSANDYQWNRAAAAGDGGTGVVTLQWPLVRRANSATVGVVRNGEHNRCSDICFAYQDPVPPIDALSIQIKHQYRFLLENIVADESFNESDDAGSSVPNINFSGYGVYNTARHITVESVHNNAIRITNQIGALLDDAVVEECGLGVAGSAIEARLSADCVIQNCAIMDSGFYGIDAQGTDSTNVCRRIRIVHNDINRCVDAGIYFPNGRGHRIEQNNLKRTGGIYADNAGGRHIISGNVCYQSNSGIRLFAQFNSAIVNNFLDEMVSGTTALQASTCESVTISGNTLLNADTYGIFIGGGNNNTVVNNLIDGVATNQGIRVHAAADRILVANNTIQNVSGGTAIYFSDDVTNSRIRENEVNGQTITLGAGSGNSADVATSYTPTVTLVGGAGNTVPVYSTNTGLWKQIGDEVFVDVYLTGDGGNEGAGTGVFSVALPKAAAATHPTSKFFIGYAVNNVTEFQLMGQIAGSATVVSLSYFNLISTTTAFTGADQNNATRTVRLKFNYSV